MKIKWPDSKYYLGIIIIFFQACSEKKVSSPVVSSPISLISDSTTVLFSNEIKAEDLKKHLTIIASDEMEGRETAKAGQKLAAKYISDYFKEIGLQPGNGSSYYQNFPVHVKNAKKIEVLVDGNHWKLIDDFYYLGKIKDTTLFDKELVFANFGVKEKNYSDFKGLDVKNKIVVVLEGAPEGVELKENWLGWRYKMNVIKELGAVGLITIENDYDLRADKIKTYVENPNLEMHYKGIELNTEMPNMFISKEKAASLLGFDGKKVYGKMSVRIDLNELLSSENVLGYLEGTDLKHELLIITAHYDHLGYDQGKICNGADDDGSGTVSILELADAFIQAKKADKGPRRSILFMTVSGEEKGLWGSRYYSENPIYPLWQTVVNLNIDMIGRRDDHHDHDNYIYLIGADRISQDLHDISSKANSAFVGMELDYTYNDPKDPNQFYYRSDHYNFAKNNIPVIFYFSGLHKDYHKPTDDVEYINFEKMEKTVRLVFYTAWEIANRTERIKHNGWQVEKK